MLVLSRKKNEAVMIGESIVVSVLEVRGDKVRLGLDAPKEIPIFRQEVALRIPREQEDIPTCSEPDSNAA